MTSVTRRERELKTGRGEVLATAARADDELDASDVVETGVDTCTVDALLAAHNLGCAVSCADEVVTGSAVEPIYARTADKEVVPVQAHQPVAPRAAEEAIQSLLVRVVGYTPAQVVCASPSHEEIVPP